MLTAAIAFYIALSELLAVDEHPIFSMPLGVIGRAN
jgi:hypothetical protein